MTTAEKLTLIAENEPKIYDKGKADGLSDFWDTVQETGARTSYTYGFAGWTEAMKPYFKPKYDIRPTTGYAMFSYNDAIDDLPALCEECGIVLDFGNCSNLYSLFAYGNVTHVGVFDTTGAKSANNVFYSCKQLHTIDKLILKTDGSQTFDANTFNTCPKLENLTVEGTIGSSNLSFAQSTGLTAESLTSILTALTKDSTKASGKSITFATANKATIEADENALAQYNAALAAGWTIAFA